MSLGDVATLAYLLIAAACIRPLAGHFAWAAKSNYDNRPEAEDWAMGAILATFLVCMWPLVILWRVVGRLAPPMGAERAALLKEREQRLREAERELGLDRWP